MDGKVFLVGAGPGDPDLLTLRGAELLAQADVVFYDGLVNPLLLHLTSGRCERTARTRVGGHAVVPQHDINRRLVEEAEAGRTVVRLKGGDPYIFGRGSEETRALTQAGVPFEVVPGITAATAAGVYAGFSWTHRDHASAVAFVTGHETPERDNSHLDYDSLARFPGTLVFYMGLGRLPVICQQLVQSGLDPQTPSSVISHASLFDQRVVTAPLHELPEVAQRAELRAPSLIVVGQCVSQREGASWFERLPLFGQRIGITRPAHQTEDVSHDVIRRGGSPVLLPLIEIKPPDERQQQHVSACLENIRSYDWLLLTSRNAVHSFLEQIWKSGLDLRCLSRLKIAVVGPSTAAELENWSLRADVVPESGSAEELAAALNTEVSGKRCLWPSADRARDTLSQLLTEKGAQVDQLVVYRHQDADSAELLQETWHQTEPHWLGLSSPAMARHAARVFPQLTSADCPTRIVSISSLTSEAARESGLTVHAEASSAGWSQMLDAVAAAGPMSD